MAIRALDLIARVSSRFVHEILPVATASVIGAMLVNHYGRQPPLPSIVVQAQPSASETAIAQSLREDHELLASFAKRREEFVKRREEQEMDAVVDPPLPEPQPAAAHIGVARLTPKAVVRKRSALPKAPLPKPDSPAIASESPPLPYSLREVGCGLPKKQLPCWGSARERSPKFVRGVAGWRPRGHGIARHSDPLRDPCIPCHDEGHCRTAPLSSSPSP
jgi:hypothetical protein